MNPDNYLYLSALLFTIGAAGVLLRRNAMVMFMWIELMLNAANLAFVAFSRMHGHLDGQVVAFFTMVVAACEVVVGLAIIMTVFRTRRSASVDDVSLLRGRRTDSWGHLLGCLAALASFAAGVVLFVDMVGRHAEDRIVHEALFSWVPVAGLHVDFGLQLDALSMCFVLLISGVGSLFHISSS